MKILQLNLLAYGPFTDTVIDFTKGDGSFHIIYGPNEAGKSSALRGLKNMLYGIPRRSTDNFIHPHPQMRIGGTIQSARGDILKFVRRKGIRGTLRFPDDGDIIEESVLTRYLNGVDEDLFITMFGIDHGDLVHGGEEIIRGKGNMGQLIFAAGSGLSRLRKVQEQLKSEADALFKPAAKKPKINENISALNKNRKNLREAQLPGQQWESHDKGLRLAQEKKKEIVNELEEKKSSLHYLKRVQQSLPIIAKRKQLINELKIYEKAILLPEKFSKSRSNRIASLNSMEKERLQASGSKKDVENELSTLKVPKDLLDRSAEIEELHRDIGSQLKGEKNRLKLQTRLNLLQKETKDILSLLGDDLKIEDAYKLRIKVVEASRIKTLGRGYDKTKTRLETAEETIPKLASALATAKTRLKESGIIHDIGPLKDSLRRADDYKVLEKQYIVEQSKIKIELKTLEIELGRQTIWHGSVKELESLSVPEADIINIFENKIGESELKIARLKDEFLNLEKNLGDAEKQISELNLKQEVPTEKDLAEAREKRDKGWHFILSILNNRSDSSEKNDDYIADYIVDYIADYIADYIKKTPPAKTLADAFEISLKKADEISDRLRREADRVTAKVKLIVDQESFKIQIDQIKNRIKAALEEKRKIEKEWAVLWEPAKISPKTPKEMRIWGESYRILAQKGKDIRERKARGDKLKTEIDHHVKILNRCIKKIAGVNIGEIKRLTDLIEEGKKIIEYENDLQKNKKHLEKENIRLNQELEQAQARVDSTRGELLKWGKNWKEALLPLGLDPSAHPDDASAVMTEHHNLFEQLKKIDALKEEINAIGLDKEKFCEKVDRIVNAVAKNMAAFLPQEASRKLNDRLSMARASFSKEETLLGQLKKDKDRIAKANVKISEIKSQLSQMCQDAGCERYEELAEAENRSKIRRELENGIKELGERLHPLSGGSLIDDFIKDALMVGPDTLEGKICLLEEEIEKCDHKKSKLDQTIGSERTELDKMDGSARAAGLAEESQILMGRLEKDAQEYSRLKIAAKILNMGIERYQEKSQGPILKRASSLFKLITKGSFEGIRAEFDDNGIPVIVGVRPGKGQIVGVEGMSDGSADQLYLALRLSGLQDYLEKNEPVPFIIDDILIKFDDARAIAALQVLAQISQQTQVIFFTHHTHLLRLVEKNIDDSIFVQHL